MEAPNKENTLYLPIKQVYFDQIIDGTKKIEYREVKEGTTANRYLIKDPANFSSREGKELTAAILSHWAKKD